MEVRIATTPHKLFIGQRIQMALTDNKTMLLWKTFMPRKKEIQNTAGNELYSIEQYPENYFVNFKPDSVFEKWAAVAVNEANQTPEGMEVLNMPDGLYAVVLHRGTALEAPNTYQYILNQWIPASGYILDHRPHFACMGDKYKNNDPDSEEELWIPIRK